MWRGNSDRFTIFAAIRRALSLQQAWRERLSAVVAHDKAVGLFLD